MAEFLTGRWTEKIQYFHKQSFLPLTLTDFLHQKIFLCFIFQ
jgi:hypothetical protein